MKNMQDVYEFMIAFGSPSAVNNQILIASKLGWQLSGDATIKVGDNDNPCLYVPLKRLINPNFSNSDAIQCTPN